MVWDGMEWIRVNVMQCDTMLFFAVICGVDGCEKGKYERKKFYLYLSSFAVVVSLLVIAFSSCSFYLLAISGGWVSAVW